MVKGVLIIRYELKNGNVIETIDNVTNIRGLRAIQQLNGLQRYYTDYQMDIEEQLNNIANLFNNDIMLDIYTDAQKYAEEHAMTLEDALCYVSEKYKNK